MTTIRIPGEMRGKGRPRFARIGPHVRAFTDAKTVSMENWVKACAVQAWRRPPLQGPVEIRLEIGVAVPASWSQKKRREALEGALLPTGKPDLDNALKLIADALNGIVWADDKQITKATIVRRYVEAPETALTVSEA
jgi:Holliday junction resolvase RusA-like endonuclease